MRNGSDPRNIILIWTLLFLLGTAEAIHATAPRPATPKSPPQIHTLDCREWRQLDLKDPRAARLLWDRMHVLAALQGLANRERPSLFIFYCQEFGTDTDQFWFDWLREPNQWLNGTSVKRLADLSDALQEFRSAYEGLAVYDERVPATSNLASTAAGCDNLLPVRYDRSPDSLFTHLTEELRIPVQLWLIHEDGSPKFTGRGTIPDSSQPSTGSAKIDAYRWAMARYLVPGRCQPGIAAYTLDAYWLQVPQRAGPEMHTLPNHDYYIARRAFFFDLAPWADEKPIDDLNQPLGLDRQTFLSLLQSLYDHADAGVTQVGGFVPWPFKYTSHAGAGKHEPVPTEWEFGRLISQYNGYMEADAAGLAALANASFYQHYPLKKEYRQPNPRPTLQDWTQAGHLDVNGAVMPKLYVGHYVGDYDAPSWLAKAVAAFFKDPTRGQVPLAWAFNPNLADRVPHVMAYAYSHATTNDFFITGDSGAGYLNARALTIRPESQLPSGLGAWTKHCRPYYQRWDMTITGFLLDGAGGRSTEPEYQAYRTFSPDGIGTHFESGARIIAGIPTCRETDLPNDARQAAALIAAKAQGAREAPQFLWGRSILKPPHWYSEVSRILQSDHPEAPVAVVDPYTFFGLIRISHASTGTGAVQTLER